MPNLSVRSRYQKLVADISGLYEGARQAFVAAYWKIGQRIVEVEQDGALKAEYGRGLLQELSRDLSAKYGAGFSADNLHNMRRFYLTHPKLETSPKLDWSQYVELLPVADDKVRAGLEKRVEQQGLPCREIRRIVRGVASAKDSAVAESQALRRPADLRLGTYRKSAAAWHLAKGRVLLDCGFFVCRAVAKEEAAGVTLTDDPAYAYPAEVERVVDGDTLLVAVDIGFGNIVREKLRLRGINTPELGLPEGERAKRFVVKLLPAGMPLVVKTHKTDNYGRFVADIFYSNPNSSPQDIVTGGVYLNQQLLDEGLAIRMAE